jgi:hypothetical protein
MQPREALRQDVGALEVAKGVGGAPTRLGEAGLQELGLDGLTQYGAHGLTSFGMLGAA